MKKCFVISPIGAPKTPIREHADDVFDYIIKPACERAGYLPARADHKPGQGSITEDMFDDILGSDLLIGLLTGHNPNVFYEVAIAQAAARPIILMMDRGDGIPFDINTIRINLYDLKPRPLMEGLYCDELVRAIQALEEKSELSVPFRPGIIPLGGGGPVWRVLKRSEEFGPAERLAMIEEANSFINMKGMALFAYAKTPRLSEAIDAALGRGVQIRALLMDPDNPALPHQLRQFATNYLSSVTEEIRGGIEFWRRKSDHPLFRLRLHSQGVMYGTMLQNESRLINTPYMLSAATSDAPIFVAPASNPLFESTMREFRYAWDLGARAKANDAKSGTPIAAMP